MYKVPLIIRGEVITSDAVEFGGRHGETQFMTPDVKKYLHRLPLKTPSAMADMYKLSISEVLDYLESLGQRLTLANPHLDEAFELSCATSGLGVQILRPFYENVGALFKRAYLVEVFERAVGMAYLEGWVRTRMPQGVVSIRAFGARAVHIVAGNSPSVSAITIARNAMTRSDAIIKTPSNDPLTAAAIARTMVDMAPDHPLTRHVSVGYWKGGDTEIEEAVYQPENIEKIVAWGGMASIKHVSKYIQPGVELIALDPKLSSTIIGRAAFESEASMQWVAKGIAADVGNWNQEACVNARVVYVESGTDKAGLANLNRLGQMVWDEILSIPPHLSGPAVRLNAELQDEIESLRLTGGKWNKVIGGGKEGGVIVSQTDEPVDFARLLANRVVNLVPVDDLETPVRSVNSYTQTIGIYPESLKEQLRDALSLQGAQRLVTLGHATEAMNHGLQDAIEPNRRMCRWIADENFAVAQAVPVAAVS